MKLLNVEAVVAEAVRCGINGAWVAARELEELTGRELVRSAPLSSHSACYWRDKEVAKVIAGGELEDVINNLAADAKQLRDTFPEVASNIKQALLVIAQSTDALSRYSRRSESGESLGDNLDNIERVAELEDQLAKIREISGGALQIEKNTCKKKS